MVARIVVASLICLAWQSNEVVAVGRFEVASAMGADSGNLEASGSSVMQGTRLMLGSLAAAEAEATDAITRSMTIQKALDVINHSKDVPSKLKALLQAPGYASVQKGQDMLNQMIQETMEKLDLERQTCYTFISTQEHLIWVATQDIRMYDARSAGAREDVMAAQTEIARLTDLLPHLTSELEEHNRKCAEDIASLEEQLKIVLGDIDVMNSVLKLTECKKALLQHVVLRTTAAKVASAKARRLLEEGLDEACEDDMPMEKPNSPDAFVQISANPTSLEPAKQREKCTLSSGSCKKLRDKFLLIQSGIEAKREELLAELATMNRHCADEKANLESQISDAETDLKTQQTNLAKATKEQNDAERNSKLKDEERTALNAELERMDKLCKVNIQNFENEKCALDKIRGELEKMKGHTNPAFLQDCEVSDWSAGECSVTCGGGTQNLTRSVSVHPVGGAACPPLEMHRKCGEDECPISCELQDWSEWGDCSAECNGGVKEKIRNILVTPQFGGQPCGETSVASSCGVQSCDEDCKLSDWSEWSQCSKECDGGLNTRDKRVVEVAVGDGKCPPTHERLEYHPCNDRHCGGNVTCESPLDVVLLLDGSGSLGEEGWAQTKKAGEMFVNALHGGEEHVKVSVILFSGPSTWSNYYRCTGSSKTGGPPDLKKDCGIDIVQHLTADMGAAVQVIKDLTWPAKSTLTSQALLTAQAELSLGRKDANSVIIVITDGKPLNVPRTKKVSKEVRKSARLMWVPVTRNVPMKDVREWASKPTSENIIQVNEFEGLSDPETITTIIADMCPKVGEIKEEK